MSSLLERIHAALKPIRLGATTGPSPVAPAVDPRRPNCADYPGYSAEEIAAQQKLSDAYEHLVALLHGPWIERHDRAQLASKLAISIYDLSEMIARVREERRAFCVRRARQHLERQQQ